MKYHYSTLLICLLCTAASCDKSELTTAPENHPGEHVALLPIPETVDLSSITLQFKGDIPHYEDTDAFLQARRAIVNSGADAFLAWAGKAGHRSMFANYLDVLEAQTEQDIPGTSFGLDAQAADYFTVDPDGIIRLQAPLIYSKMMDENGRFYIGEDLHLFIEDYHIVIDNGTPEVAQAIIDRKPLPEAAEVLVSKLENGNGYAQADQKVRTRFFACPDDFINSNMSESVYIPDKHYLQYANLVGGDRRLQAAYFQMDEQRVGCSRRRCRQRTYSTFYGEAMVTELLGTQFRAICSIMHDYANYRRSGLHFIRTFPDVRFEPLLRTHPLMEVQYAVTLRNSDNDQLFEMLDVTETVSYPSTAEEINAHNGSAEGTWILSEVNQLITYPVFNAYAMRIEGTILTGRTRHRWINRGNDPINDPISVEFGCN